METIRRVTVFGGDGFIGRYVVRRLAAQGATVIVYGRRARDAGFLRPMGNPGQIVLANGDIRDQQRVAGAIADSDAVVNLVGILLDRSGHDFFQLHRDAAKLIAEEAASAGARNLVHFSAIGADPAAESRYAKSKGEGERIVLDVFPKATIIRPSIVFGIEDQFFNRFAQLAKFSPVLPIVGGTTRFQPVYVDDLATAVVQVLTREEAAGWTYELGGPEILNFRALIALLLQQLEITRRIIDLPLPLARLTARILSPLPDPPITPDQIILLQRDNIVSPEAATLASLGIAATPLAAILPRIAARFRALPHNR